MKQEQDVFKDFSQAENRIFKKDFEDANLKIQDPTLKQYCSLNYYSNLK